MPDSMHTFGRYTENMQVAFGENFSNLVLFVALLSSCVNLGTGDMQCHIKIFRSEVGQMKILVRVCTRLGSDAISISITGGALARGVCLSTFLLNIINIKRKTWAWKL